MIHIEPVKAIDGGDGACAWHRNVPRWLLSHQPMKEIASVRLDPLNGRRLRINRREVGRAQKGAPKPGLGRLRGGFTTKIHFRVSGACQPIRPDITPGKTSDYLGNHLVRVAHMPEANILLADCSCNPDKVGKTMQARNGWQHVTTGPPKASWASSTERRPAFAFAKCQHDENKNEINAFGAKSTNMP